MLKNTLGLPTGYRDVVFDEARSRRLIERQFAEVFEKRGFGEISPSGVEYLDVYTRGRQSIKELTFKFLDRDDNLLALRADFTPAIARIAAARLQNMPLPIKIWYSGSVFRKADLHRGRFHEFIQVGAELLGQNTAGTDADGIPDADDDVRFPTNGNYAVGIDLTDPSDRHFDLRGVCLGSGLQAELVAGDVERAEDATTLGGDLSVEPGEDGIYDVS